MSKKKRFCPKCGSKCNTIDWTPEIIYVFCTGIDEDTNIECPYQTWEPKHKIRDSLIHEIKEIYKN